MWVATHDLPRNAAHPFYTRLNQILDKSDFDGHVESLCHGVYADEVGRPGLSPGRYFRMLLLGYFEAERAIAWRAADSLSVRSFPGLELHDAPPDHSTVSHTRRPCAVRLCPLPLEPGVWLQPRRWPRACGIVGFRALTSQRVRQSRLPQPGTRAESPSPHRCVRLIGAR
jgi:hypothetical protein